MIEKYKKEIIILCSCLLVCITSFIIIKVCFFKNVDPFEPITNVLKFYKQEDNVPKLNKATTVPLTSKRKLTTNVIGDEYEDIDMPEISNDDYPYKNPPLINDDGSIIYEGKTLTELTEQLNKSLSNSYLTNTGYFFAKYTKDTGLDPYLSVAIVLLETGCKWECSGLTKGCYNIGGLKGHGSCNGTSYSKYDTLEEGIDSYLDIIYYNYYLKGLTTPEKMNSKYAESPVWAEKVNNYIKEIRTN